MSDLASRFHMIQERLHQAAHNAGRDPANITLIAVSKTWPADILAAAYAAGARHFGENRTHELEEKRTALGQSFPPDDPPTWHYIAPLQSRQTGTVADYADIFHAVDRLKIAKRLSRQLKENGRSLPVFLEVNISGEGSKSGFPCHQWEKNSQQRENLQKIAQTLADMPGLQPQGLMTMAPWGAPVTTVRQIFARTRELSLWLQTAVPHTTWTNLSMGMTDDFELAIAEGATHVRVGRAIFGSRH
ncbi:MAG TPA: YggS family pyridoxal phosphate-dependent enzyme [Anaerolineae bacterium]|nr:YggS family pyridoxal phosphate-dependent enzyme [Anaerolineae bacterium]